MFFVLPSAHYQTHYIVFIKKGDQLHHKEKQPTPQCFITTFFHLLFCRTEVVDSNDAAAEDAEDVTMEAEAVTDNPGDAMVTAQDTSHEVKPENRDKCDKCLKVSFRYRHDNFCSKCVANNLLDEAEQDKLDNVVRCRKCAKIKFR